MLSTSQAFLVKPQVAGQSRFSSSKASSAFGRPRSGLTSFHRYPKSASRRSTFHVKAASGVPDPGKVPDPQGGSGVDCGGGVSAERKAGQALSRLFTFAACKSILQEIEGYDNEGGAGGDPVYQCIQNALVTEPIDDKFVSKLMQNEDAPELRLVALRIMEVRKAMLEEKFDWKQMQAYANQAIQAESEACMKTYMESLNFQSEETESGAE